MISGIVPLRGAKQIPQTIQDAEKMTIGEREKRGQTEVRPPKWDGARTAEPRQLRVSLRCLGSAVKDYLAILANLSPGW